MLGVLSVVVALATGILFVYTADPLRGMRPRWAAILFNAGLGAGIGAGSDSVLFLLLTVTGKASPVTILSVDMVVLGALIAVHRRADRRPSAIPVLQEMGARFRATRALAIALGISLLMVFSRLVWIAAANPAGEWDAWAIWNLRAKFLAGPADSWRYAVSPLLERTHPDYPLLLSSFVARVWKFSGTTNSVAPIATGFIFFGALIAVLVSGLALVRGTASGLLAGFVLFSTTPLLLNVPAQYSDIPLAFYCLATIALLFVDALPESTHDAAIFWAGLCAGFASWTKNEGIVFLALVLIVFFAASWRDQGMKPALMRSRLLLAGAAPGILLTLWFKFFLAPGSDPLIQQGIFAATAKLRDASRYAQIARAFMTELIHLGSAPGHPLILVTMLAIILRPQMNERYKLPVKTSAMVLGLMFLSYCGVYLITPSDLTWHLQTSFGRLILHIWPSFLLLGFAVLGRIEEDPEPVAGAKATGSTKSASHSRRKKAKTGEYKNNK